MSRRHDSYTHHDTPYVVAMTYIHHDTPSIGAMTLIFTMTHHAWKIITVFYLIGKKYYFTVRKSAATGS